MRALFVNLSDGRALPFQVPDDWTLQDDENVDGFMTRGGGFLALSDGTELWVDPRMFVTAYLTPKMEPGQGIGIRA